MKTQNHLRRRLTEGQPVFGVWLQLAHPPIAELMAMAGYDMVLIDMEHGPNTLVDTANMMRGIAGTGSSSMVRVPWNDHVVLKRLLDQGPDAVMIPMVETAEEARAAVAACHYPPKGRRGFTGIGRAARYGFDPDYPTVGSHDLVIAVQIESVKGAENADAIAATDGVDVVFVGRNDLAADSGHFMDLDHPEVDAWMNHAFDAARRHGKKTGTVPSAGRGWQQLVRDGIDMVVPSADTSFLLQGAASEIAAYRKVLGLPDREDTPKVRN